MRPIHAAGLLWLMLSGLRESHGQTQLPTLVGGLTDVRTVDGQKEWVYQWPGIYFEARFRGESVSLHMDDANNWFDVLVDGRNVMLLKRPGKAVVALDHLGAGEHDIRLEKRTETKDDTGAFVGFFVDKAEDALTAPVRARRILFLGDSLTVGYGNTSQDLKCSKEEIFETTDTSEAFGPLVAKHFDAEYQVRAFSGLGLIRNYGGTDHPQYHLPSLWQSVLFASPTKAEGELPPQVVVIGIGGNDFSTQVTAKERWKTQADLADDYANTYVEFLKYLRQVYPRALIVMTWTADMLPLYTQTAEKVLAQAKADGVSNIEGMPFPAMGRTGCGGHPNLRDDAKIAGMLETLIAAHPQVWEDAAEPGHSK